MYPLMQRGVAIACFISAFSLRSASGSTEGFLHPGRRGHQAMTTELFQQAMGEVMGCGGEVEKTHLLAIENALLPTWRVLPKNSQNLLEWRLVRYLAHRYFMQKSSLLVRGFEPMRQINSSHFGVADLLHKSAPHIVDSAMDSKRTSQGFSLQETVAMIATLDQLMRDAELELLETVYKRLRKSTQSLLSHRQLSDVIEAYMIYWMMDDDKETINILMNNRSLLVEVLPKWPEVRYFVEGLVKHMEVSNQKSPKKGSFSSAMVGQYAFNDAHRVVSSITREFASFWESECQLIKQSLVALDKTGTGRVSITDFYGANSDGEWRFGESVAYLRELGALDESSMVRGQQVIIPNYLQGASNCIVATPNYLVCCVNECEEILTEIEATVGSPFATPQEVLPLVGNVTDFNDDPPNIDETLRNQLLRIAETHGGRVPLHGRLFSQWLHYVFPRECPFPHKAGKTTAQTPLQYGDDFIASEAEVAAHAARRDQNLTTQTDLEEAQWMSQWSEEEELIADYSAQLKAPWETNRGAFFSFGALALAVLVFSAKSASNIFGSSKVGDGSFETRTHFV